jgi:hypothetical protein
LPARGQLSPSIPAPKPLAYKYILDGRESLISQPYPVEEGQWQGVNLDNEH